MSGVILTILLFLIVVVAVLLILHVADWALSKIGEIPRPASILAVVLVAIICIVVIIGFLQARNLITLF